VGEHAGDDALVHARQRLGGGGGRCGVHRVVAFGGVRTSSRRRWSRDPLSLLAPLRVVVVRELTRVLSGARQSRLRAAPLRVRASQGGSRSSPSSRAANARERGALLLWRGHDGRDAYVTAQQKSDEIVLDLSAHVACHTR
jgi:hypothetical protein